MDGDKQTEQRDHPADAKMPEDREPHAGIEPAEPNNRGNDDAIVQLELARRTERSARLTMIATVAIALGTVALAGATFHLASSTVDVADQTKRVADRTQDLAKATDNLVDLAREQGRDTKAAIQAASRQATAAEQANRVSRDPGVSVAITGMGIPAATSKYVASFGVFAYGRSPALHVKGQAAVTILPEPQLPETLSECPFCGESVLYPSSGLQGSGLSFSSLPTDISPSIMSELKDKTKTLFFTGRVDYYDQDKNHHHITVCNLYKADENQTGPCPIGNDAD